MCCAKSPTKGRKTDGGVYIRGKEKKRKKKEKKRNTSVIKSGKWTVTLFVERHSMGVGLGSK